MAGLLNKELNEIFQRMGLSMMDGGMVSISGVKITPDFLVGFFWKSGFRFVDEFCRGHQFYFCFFT